jgi:type II pantothenate kinase
MNIVIDLGGSTVDILEFFTKHDYRHIKTFGSHEVDKSDLGDILKKADLDRSTTTQLILTGGHHRRFNKTHHDIPVAMVSEIEAIGTGARHLTGMDDILACSLGTGTCCVSVKNKIIDHVGGTGVGGGTFLGLCKTMLGENSFAELKALSEQGNTERTDILVREIVGGGIGFVPGSATAANFAKADPNLSAADIVAGIANLVGQTIASIAVFAARAEHHNQIVFGGKLTRIPAIGKIAERTAAIYNRSITIPPDADFMSAVGAGIWFFQNRQQ